MPSLIRSKLVAAGHRRRVEDRRHRHVHVHARRLEVEEGGVESGEAFHGPQMMAHAGLTSPVAGPRRQTGAVSWLLLLLGVVGLVHAANALSPAQGIAGRVRVELLRLVDHDRARLAPPGRSARVATACCWSTPGRSTSPLGVRRPRADGDHRGAPARHRPHAPARRSVTMHGALVDLEPEDRRAAVPAQPRRLPVPRQPPHGRQPRARTSSTPAPAAGASASTSPSPAPRPGGPHAAPGPDADPRRRVGHRRQARAGPAAAQPHGRPGLGRASTSTTGSAPAWPSPTTSSTSSAAWRGSRSTPTSTASTPTSSASPAARPGGHLTALMGLTANDPAFQPGFEDADTSVAAAVPVLRHLRLHRRAAPSGATPRSSAASSSRS